MKCEKKKLNICVYTHSGNESKWKVFLRGSQHGPHVFSWSLCQINTLKCVKWKESSANWTWLISSSYLTRSFASERKSKQNWILFHLSWEGSFFSYFHFILFFLCKAVQQQCTTVYGAEYLRLPSPRVSAESLSSHAGRTGCFALKQDLTVCVSAGRLHMVLWFELIKE